VTTVWKCTVNIVENECVKLPVNTTRSVSPKLIILLHAWRSGWKTQQLENAAAGHTRTAKFQRVERDGKCATVIKRSIISYDLRTPSTYMYFQFFTFHYHPKLNWITRSAEFQSCVFQYRILSANIYTSTSDGPYYNIAVIRNYSGAMHTFQTHHTNTSMQI